MPKQYQDEALLDKIILTLKEVRKIRGMTLETIYFDTGIHIARIEQGKTNITVSTLAKLCAYYDIGLLDFFIKVYEK
jgi:transcriptional regulator with XRE-family HTH domain